MRDELVEKVISETRDESKQDLEQVAELWKRSHLSATRPEADTVATHH